MRGTVVQALAAGGLLAALVLLSPSGRAQTQGDMPEKVKFTSVDGVELHGTFYGSSKNDSAPAVLIVHAIGDSSRRKEYDNLARTLQGSGYAVLTFDLRGHGQSKSVDKDEFWSQKYKNYTFVAGASARKESIEFRDIDKRFYSVFVNDLAAAKAFLDRKNDAKKCNSSSMIVIGADSGATLGAIWINSEWARYKLIPPAAGFGQPQPDLKNPEGKNVICGIWLSITPDLGTRKVPLASVLFTAAKEKKVPMVFLYNSDFSIDKSTAVTLVKGIKGKDKTNFELTAASPVKAGGKLTGRELLNPALETDKAIAAYLPKVIEDKGNEWQEQEARKAQYVWKSGFQTTPAKLLPADSAIRFSLYNQFMTGSR
jgi:alpha-beta hydrolase superfamily lysophospholipase